MSKILILGATGSLGSHVVHQAVSTNHEVSTLIRTPSALPVEIQEEVVVYKADMTEISTSALANIFQAHDVVINTAGYVTQGKTFTDLIDHIVTGLESIPEKDRPVCWFLAGAALLDIDESGRRGVDLPVISSTYWPHQVNFDRIHQTTLDWRILCPGPMVDQPTIGLDRMRISLDKLPIHMPVSLRPLSEEAALQFLTQHIHEMTVSYADAAALMLAHITPNDAMSHHRVGLALPVDMRSKK
ncbi:MAG: NAD(P)H-binding protein [Chloroflexi bacterium]|nr:NAD(P)H-binding protein [Chloroflexota bacterium]